MTFLKKVYKNFIKKESLVQVFSCEFCEISKYTFFYRTPVAASESIRKILKKESTNLNIHFFSKITQRRVISKQRRFITEEAKLHGFPISNSAAKEASSSKLSKATGQA